MRGTFLSVARMHAVHLVKAELETELSVFVTNYRPASIRNEASPRIPISLENDSIVNRPLVPSLLVPTRDLL